MEDIYSKLGNPGKFQICVFLLLAMNLFPIAFNHVCMAFTAYSPPHWCRPSKTSHDAVISPFQTQSISNNSVEYWTSNSSYNAVISPFQTHVISNSSVWYSSSNSSHNAGISPFQTHATSNNSVEYWKCKGFYDFKNGSEFLKCFKGDWVYQLEEGESTIVSEWDLVCDAAPLPNIANAVFFVGLMCGGLMFGYLSDRYGRRPVILATLYLPIAVGVGLAYVQRLETFMLLRFFQGVLMQGLQTASYVLVVEWFSVRHRTIAGCLLSCYWGMGVISLGGIAYVAKDWRTIQLAISLPSLLTVGYIWLIPESLRWLHARGRVKETNRLIKKVAKFNKLDNPLDCNNYSLWVKQTELESRGKLIDVIRTPSMRKRSLPLFVVWIAANVGYYGLTLKSTSLAGNRYLNFSIASGLEFIAYAIGVIVAKTFGRRRPLSFYFFLAGVCCIVSGVLPTRDKPELEMVSTAFAIGGKFAVGGIFSVIELFTSELYPTVIRNMGMGVCAFFGRVGAALAPQFVTLGVYTSEQVPVIIYGVLTLLGGVLTLCLPETMDANLPDTVHEVQTLLTPSQVKTLISDLDLEIEVPTPINKEDQCSKV